MDVQSELKGKKLLLMSGSQDACEIVKEAKKLGIIVYATDYYETSPVKKIADKSFMVSTADVDAIVDLCKKEQVDGIFSGYTDSVLPFMQQVAKKANLPFWGNKENIDICIDKKKFKEACKKAGVKTIPSIYINIENYLEKIKDVECPVVVKPVDNSGSRGVFKCYNKEDLRSMCEKSFDYSLKKELLIEKLMNVDSEFSVYYILSETLEGTRCAILSSMGDRYVDVVDENTAPQAKGMFFPSIHLNKFIEKADNSIREFFRQNSMRNGFVFIQGFVEDDDFFISEIGYRLNGGFTYKFTEYYNGYNQVKELIKFSLTGKMDDTQILKSSPYFNGIGLLITISLKEGIIDRISGIEEIKKHKNIIDFIPLHFEGDDLRAHGTSRQIFGYACCVASTYEGLEEVISFVRDNLVVDDTNGESMIIGIINSNDIKNNTNQTN